MKKVIILLTALLISFSACADSARKLENNVFKSVKSETVKVEDTETPYKWEVKQNGKIVELPIYITKKGKCYIIRTSKEGKQYKQYLPKEQTEQIQKFVGYESDIH